MSLKGNRQGWYTGDWWLEYLEGEFDRNLEKDMDRLLSNSISDCQILQELAFTRETIKAVDNVPLPEDGRFYELLHAKIMGAIEDEKTIDANLAEAIGFEDVPAILIHTRT